MFLSSIATIISFIKFFDKNSQLLKMIKIILELTTINFISEVNFKAL